MCMPTPSNVSGFGYSWGFANSADLSKAEVDTPSSLSYTLGNTVSPETTLTVMSHKTPQVQEKVGTTVSGARVVTATGAGGQRRTMFLVNESPSHANHRTAQQNHTTIQTTNLTSKFMSPIGPIQLTAEECNEILMKRALQAQGIATPVIDASQLNHTLLNGGLKSLTEANQAADNIQTTVHQHHLLHAKQEPGTANSSPKLDDVQTAYSQTECVLSSVGGGNMVTVKERPYNCEECGKSFLLKHHLTTHARVHTGERPHVCVHCGKAFAHKHCLNTHLLLHSTDRPFQCHECKKSFTLKHHLLTHSRVHSRDRPFVCGECGRSFPLKRHLVTHSKYHAGERPFVCGECGESFAQKDHLVMHSRFHGSLNPFVCGDCGASFARKFQLVNHGRVHGRVPHACPVCSKEFLQKRTLVAHMKLHTGEGVVACLECGEAFKAKSELQQHCKLTRHCTPQPQQSQPQHETINKMDDMKPQILQVIGADGQVVSEKTTPGYACTECGSCFNTKEALALHVRLHAGDRTCVTDLCALTAALQPGLVAAATQQQQTTQQSQQQTTQASPNIQIISSNPSSNVVHTQVIASNHMTPPRPKVHFCGDCGKGFAAKHGLQQHNRRHPDGGCTLRTHVCDTCGKAFFQKNHLMLHQRQHMDLPPRQQHSQHSQHQQSQQQQQHQQQQQQQQQQHQQQQQNNLQDPLEDHQPTHIQVVTNRSGQVIGNQILVGGVNARRQLIGSQVHIIGRDGKTIGTQVTHSPKERHHNNSGDIKDVGGSLVLSTSRTGLIKYEISIPQTSVVQVQNLD